MARFVFKLQTVLKHRLSVERQKQGALAQAMIAQKQLEDELTQLQESIRLANDDLRKNRLVGRVDVTFIMAHRRFLVAVHRKGMELVNRIAQAKRAVDAARTKLAEAAKQRMILEKLRDKQQERFVEEQNRRELNQLDEVAMQMSYLNMQ